MRAQLFDKNLAELTLPNAFFIIFVNFIGLLMFSIFPENATITLYSTSIFLVLLFPPISVILSSDSDSLFFRLFDASGT